MSARVPATCPALDRLARLVRRLDEPHQSAARAEIEWLREAHIRLRAAAADADPRAIDVLGAMRRRESYEAHVDQLIAWVEDEAPRLASP